MNLFTSFFIVAQALPAAGTAPSPWMQYMPLLFIGVIFYFLLIRPQQKQRRDHQSLLASLKTGDKVVTSAGIHGIIANIKEKTFLVKVADNVKVEVDKAAIAAVLEKETDTTVVEK